MIKNIVFGLAGLAVIGAAQASNWVPISVTSKNSTFMVDADSIVNEPNGAVRAWFLMKVEGTARLVDGTTYDSEKFINRYYCKTRQVSFGPSYWYLANNNVYAEPGYTVAAEIIPDSVADGLASVLCTKK